ncbi:MAG TPA: cytochrome c oxidase subunit II [Blastocatellia bacterium]|jgi:cytochrome c oxidase subunit 2|nr:cytochrome c oxidase subunit II [Blastocatellia bacterium]
MRPLIIKTIVCLAVLAAAAAAQPSRPIKPSDIGFDQRLDEQVPLELAFRDENGKTVRLGDYINRKPVILALVYYQCPMLCNQALNGLAGSLKALSFDAGREFEVIAVSFNPRETSELAAAKKENYVRDYGRAGAAAGWHFLTGDPKPIDALTRAVGFRYAYDPMLNQYAHASGVVILTPGGRVARYFYGIEYAPRDLRLGLIEAAEERIGTPVDQVLLLCYQYDPKTGKYSAAVMKSLRLGGVVTALGMVALLFALSRKAKSGRGGVKPTNYCFLTLGALFIPFLPERASSFAGDVDALFFTLVGISIFFAMLIAGLEIYFAVKYRRRSPGEIPPKTVSSFPLEVAWIAIPFLICMVIFVWGASLYYTIYSAPKETMEIYVTAKQWMWRFQHVGGQREINGLHVPVGSRVKLTMTSEDVIHSFFVPAFRVKADVLPGQGRYRVVWFEPTKVGRYRLFCAEYCGANHSGMGGWVEVMQPQDFQAWLGGGVAGESMASSGQKLFQQLACNTCHKADGAGRCPALEGLFGKQVELQGGQKVTVDESYIRESILNPTAKIVAGYEPIMPNFTGQVSEEQVSQLIAYIKSIGGQQQGTALQSPRPKGAAPTGSTPARGTP